MECGSSYGKAIPISKENILPLDENDPNYKRHLDDVEYHDFHIYFDFVTLDYQITKFNWPQTSATMIKNAIKKAISTLDGLLQCSPTPNIYWSDEDMADMEIEVWDTSVGCLGDNPSKGMSSLGYDLMIFPIFSDGLGNTFASSTSFYVGNDKRPLTGVITINSQLDLSIKNSESYLTRMILHEFIHILGFEQIYINDVFHFLKQIQDPNNANLYHNYIVSPKVVEVAKKYYKCSTVIGGKLNSYDSPLQHWNARYLLGDIMSKIAYTEEEVISEFTLAYLEDTQFYKAKYYTGGLMKYGKGKGCEFLDEICIDKTTYKTNPKFGNEFFDTFRTVQYPSIDQTDPGCTSGRLGKGYHYLDTLTTINNKDYLYYGNAKGGYGDAEYCPVNRGDTAELKIDYYVGNCNSLGSNGSFGNKLKYFKGFEYVGTNMQVNLASYADQYLDILNGQTYSDHSFCYLSSLFNNSPMKDGTILPEALIRPVCYESFCSSKSLTIKIFDDYFVCPRQGGNIQVQGYNGTFSCPDYYLICSGTVMCNDMYDCVQKKSEIKEESYNYDYTPLTTQNISTLTSDLDNKNNYELSDDGKCPKYCKHCKEGRICVTCNEDSYFLASKTSSEKGCVLKSEVANGYYKDPNNPNEQNVYYKCIDHCLYCDDIDLCTKCEPEYYNYFYAFCLETIENCEVYTINGDCEKCFSGYSSFKNDNVKKCVVTIENCAQYLEDGSCEKCKSNYNLLYKKCLKNIDNCEEYSEDGSCKKCASGYNALFNICIKNIDNCEEYSQDGECSKCSNGYTYYSNSNVKKCIKNIDNCEEYSEDGSCTKCASGYNLLYNKCLKNIDNCEEYSEDGSCTKCATSYNVLYNKCLKNIDNCDQYLEDGACSKCSSGYTYYSNNNSNKCIKAIDNCEEYSEDEACQKCSNNYAFKESARDACYPKTDLENYYYTRDQGISYYQCSEHCKKCRYEENPNLRTMCDLCDDGFYVYVRDETCIAYDSSTKTMAIANETHIDDCNQFISDCQTCEDKNTCIKCSTNTIISDKVTCVNDAELNVEHYYLSGEKTYYDCTNSKYNDIQNCYICSNKESCTQCQNGYTFLDGDKTNCAQIESLENEYILDSADKTNYISCSKIYENCQACDKDKCLTCKEGFVFVNNDFSKCSVEDNGGIPVISKDEAEKLASISLSYEQINNFNYDSNNNKITFDLSTLTTVGEANIGDEIKVYVNLIYNSGTADVKSTESS